MSEDDPMTARPSQSTHETYRVGEWQVSYSTLGNRERVAVYEQGPPDGPPVLLFHGSPGGTVGSWTSLARGLSDTFHLIAIDYPGHGTGARPTRGFRAEPFSFDTVLEDAVALLDARGLTQVTLVGYSLGGVPALTFARAHPERLNGLVLCSTALQFPRLRSTPILERIAGSAPTTKHASDMNTKHIPSRIIGRFHEVLRTNLRAAVQAELAAEAFNATSWIEDIKVPTAVVISENDSVVSTASQEELAALLPSASCARLPGHRGHLSIPFASSATREVMRNICPHMSRKDVDGQACHGVGLL